MDPKKGNLAVSVSHLLSLKPTATTLLTLPIPLNYARLLISLHVFPSDLVAQVPPLLNPSSPPLPARTPSLPRSFLLLHSPAPGPRTDNSNSSSKADGRRSPDLSRGWERGRV